MPNLVTFGYDKIFLVASQIQMPIESLGRHQQCDALIATINDDFALCARSCGNQGIRSQACAVDAAVRLRPQYRTGVEFFVDASLGTQSCIAPLVDQAAFFERDRDTLDFKSVRVKVDNVLIDHLNRTADNRRVCDPHD